MGVTEYWRFDATGHRFAIVPVRCPLRGRTGTEDGRYRRMPRSNDDGILRVHSEVLGLDFCVLPDLELRLYDPATGQWLPSHEESETARQAPETALRPEQEARQASDVARQAAGDEVRMLRQRLKI